MMAPGVGPLVGSSGAGRGLRWRRAWAPVVPGVAPAVAPNSIP
ncbi:hypothetical protein [Hyalangium minutum]|uniref:Uncharacterized protein n=1 Tax=Hyalangium minutum TaxID=394096 RepID=A0A085WNH3_9BACT|nr:hypothetical protein [Hyalangium minutum]KFE69236.1 hypothetical protein DB31_7138 [Hyalangium minutum]